MTSGGDAQKLRFGPWLVSAVSSGNYQGLCWIDLDAGVFRIPWKHNSRKDVTSSDREIFKAWAKASGRYKNPENPAKWKTNFRCALKSTRMFVELEDHSRCGDDPHKVFAIDPDIWHGKEGDFSSPNPAVDQQPLHQQSQLQFDPQDVAPEIAPPGCTDPVQPSSLEELQWVLQQCGISPRDLGPPTPSWAPAGDAPQQDLPQPYPDLSQNSCHQLPHQQWVPAAEQPPLGAYSPPDPVLLEQQGAMPPPCHQPEAPIPVAAPQEVMLLAAAAAAPVPPAEDNTNGFIPILDVSIYYRGKLIHQEEVVGSQCLLVYQSSDPAVAELPGRRVHFPSPAKLADKKQRQLTEELLCGAGLQLEQRAHKLFATRLKKSHVFWALSRQLEGTVSLPPNLLQRGQKTPIFDFTEFCTELRDFRNNQRKRSPDFTIYLCFGQSFVEKPKESKLILVKLVPKFCEYWYEQVLREGVSSLDSDTVSLQLSDSFSLFELIEQYNMQLD